MRFFYLHNNMKLEQLYELFLTNRNITTDSRIVKKNDLFFALKGDHFDGNQFAEKAITNGCAYAIIDNPEYKKDERYILVDDVLETLQKLGNCHRKKLNIPILAITGTNGKTTTKELIAAVLNKKFKLCYTQGNLNNHIGVPLTLLAMDEKTNFGVVEMGANHMFEIKKLCEIAEPDFGIITNIGKAHLEGFGSVENIRKTKKELYDYLSEHSGKVFYNKSNPILTDIVEELAVQSVSFAGDYSKVSGEVQLSEQFLSVTVKINNTPVDIQTQLVGAYNLENILAAVAVGEYFNVPVKSIKEAIEAYVPKNNRSQFIKSNSNNIYLDAYNANPTSVELSLKNFVSLKKPNACLILGDMLELGEEAAEEHKKVLRLIDNYSFDKIILVGSIYSSIYVKDDVLQFENVNEFKKWFTKNEIKDSHILIKGSRGIQLETIVEYL